MSYTSPMGATSSEKTSDHPVDTAALKASLAASVEALSDGMEDMATKARAQVQAISPFARAEATPASGPRAGWFLRSCGKLWLRVAGWKTVGEMPASPYAVFIASPHTSNWDLPFALAVAWAMDIRISWAGKSSLFRFPFAGFMRWLGGISVERSKRDNQVEKIAQAMRAADKMYLVVAPSGTRSKRDQWKSGFYHIAKAANVPILLAFLDYERKEGGLGPLVYASDDVAHDMGQIRAFYADKRGKHPAQETVPRLKEEDAPAS